MFTAYIKYISLLLFSGLILTFYRAALPSTQTGAAMRKALNTLRASEQRAAFSLFNDVIRPLFPALNTNDMPAGNKK